MKVKEYLDLYKENKKFRDFSEYADILSVTSKSRKNNNYFLSNNSLNNIQQLQHSSSQSPNNYAAQQKQRHSQIGKRIKTVDEESWEDFASKQLSLIQQCVQKPIAIINLSIIDNGKKLTIVLNIYEDSNIDQIIRRVSSQYNLSLKKQEELRQQIFKFLY